MDRSCRVWLLVVQFFRLVFFQQYLPTCSKWWVRIFYLMLIIMDALLSLVPVLYAFEQSLRMPFISILFFYPLLPIISIALNIICVSPRSCKLIVWHPVFLRVLISFNALSALNPVTALIIAAIQGSIPTEVGDFWLFSTVGMLLIKIPLSHISALHLAWVTYPSYSKQKVSSFILLEEAPRLHRCQPSLEIRLTVPPIRCLDAREDRLVGSESLIINY